MYGTKLKFDGKAGDREGAEAGEEGALAKYARDLTAAAAEGKLDPVSCV